jgi:replication fork protection complex subunit Csm3/Swi3
MLNMYQLWLDDLYPRAKFADALAMVEKVGHTKRMQIMRKDWIDEGKPRRTTERDDEEGDRIVLDTPSADQVGQGIEGVAWDTTTEQPEVAQAQNQKAPGSDGDPNEDELDALLAEGAQQDVSAPKPLPVRTVGTEDDPFADAMEAMADMDDVW